ncbi:MAG: chromosome segregation protein SMC, partial [Acidobacteria bacterium]|nr:chromosome segregation protein SMC [Acidobacteriota bacterium]
MRRGADASGTLLAEPGRFGGVLGSVADLLTVQDGAADAISAALGAAATAVAVSGLDAAVDILAALKSEDAGQAALMIASGQPAREPGPGGAPPAPVGDGASKVCATTYPTSVMRALDLVKAPDELAAAVEQLLDGVLVAADLGQGLDLVRSDPRLRVVTRDGDLIGAHWARGGSAGAPSLLGLRAAEQEAAARLDEAERRAHRAERELADASEDEDGARHALAEALAGLQEADAAAAETSGRLGTLAGTARAAQDEAARLAAAIAAAERAREKGLAQLADLQGKLAVQEAEGPAGPGQGPGGDGEEGGGRGKNALAAEATAARNAEMEARLEVRTVEERLRAVAGRGDALASAAAAERQAIQRAKARSVRRAQEAAVADAVAAGATTALAAIERSRAKADSDRQAAERASRTRDGELKQVRVRIRELTAELDTAVSSAHGAEPFLHRPDLEPGLHLGISGRRGLGGRCVLVAPAALLADALSIAAPRL